MSGVFKKIKSAATIFFLSFRAKKTIKVFLTLIAFFSIASVILAQTSVSNSMSSVYLSMYPTSPRPGDSVVLTVSSDLLDLNSSKIIWYIDGVAKQGITSKSITVKAKSDGKKTEIKVVVETSDGITQGASGEISPSGVDLVIEPMSYTMPFYKGKPLFVGQGTVKIVALPDVMIGGKKMASKDLNFKWTEDDIVLGSNSGKGADSIIINGSIPTEDINVRVEISDNSGNVLAETSKSIILNNPEILFYENNPLYGILYNEAVTGTYNLGTREDLTVVAKPFSFGFTADTPNNAIYTWSMNGNSITPSGKANEIILKQATIGTAGTAAISLDLRNNDEITQYTSGSFNVNFGV